MGRAHEKKCARSTSHTCHQACYNKTLKQTHEKSAKETARRHSLSTVNTVQ